MELLLIIVAIVAYNIWIAMKKSPRLVSVAQMPFEIRVRKQTDHFESLNIEVFVVEMRGAITAPYDNYSASTALIVRDVTGGEDHPVFTAVESQQLGGTPVLGPKMTQTIPYRSSVINDWVVAWKTPIDLLTFPRKGTRKIKFSIVVGGTSAVSSIIVTHECATSGYLEISENRQKFESLTLQLAFAVSVSDGSPDDRETGAIKTWGKERVQFAPETQREQTKARLNAALRDAVQMFNDGVLPDVASICRGLKEVTTVAERYEALELCLHVAKADGVAEQRELELLGRLASLLDVDQTRFREMKDKHLPVTIMNISRGADIDQLLGITAGLSSEEVKKHLRKEFQKWNQLSTHSSAEKREQAKRMLEMIAKKRSELADI